MKIAYLFDDLEVQIYPEDDSEYQNLEKLGNSDWTRYNLDRVNKTFSITGGSSFDTDGNYTVLCDNITIMISFPYNTSEERKLLKDIEKSSDGYMSFYQCPLDGWRLSFG